VKRTKKRTTTPNKIGKIMNHNNDRLIGSQALKPQASRHEAYKKGLTVCIKIERCGGRGVNLSSWLRARLTSLVTQLALLDTETVTSTRLERRDKTKNRHTSSGQTSECHPRPNAMSARYMTSQSQRSSKKQRSHHAGHAPLPQFHKR